jgi:hypothetical protein
MRYIVEPELPRILMLDCADELVASVKQDAHNVEVGYTGFFKDHPLQFAPNLHEKDIVFVDLEPGWASHPADHLYPIGPSQHVIGHLRDLRPGSGGSLERFIPAFARGALLICLMEAKVVHGASARWQSFDWLAGSRVTSSPHVSDDRAFHVADDTPPELEQLLIANRESIRGERILHQVSPLLHNDAGEIKAGWEVEGRGGRLFLPYFDRKTTAVRRLLRDVLPTISPQLFPARGRPDWHEADDYQLSRVLSVRQQRTSLLEEHASAMERLAEAEALAHREQEPFLALLTAQSDALRVAVRHALEWFGFEEVVDEDERRRAAGIEGKAEDLQLKDGDYFAVVEVTSGKGGAREKDYEDLVKYQRRRQETPGRQDIEPLTIRGLLVMNQHLKPGLEPGARADLFEGNENAYPGLARTMGFGLLATYELFTLIRKVEAGEMTREAARNVVKTPGLIIARNGASDPGKGGPSA